MTIQFQCRQDKTIPKLGWIAIADTAENRLNILHGEFVEHGSDWLVEGVWDGRFQDGVFNRSDFFFGSGVRKESDKIFFVPSIAQTDRILLCRDKDDIVVSNSLLLLLGYTGASLDNNHDYQDESTSIALKGFKNYKKGFRIIHPTIKQFYQVYHENVVLEKGEITFEPKTRDMVFFESYQDYYQSLVEKLKEIQVNYSSRYRRWPIKAYTTISSGYDSTAASCLAKEVGVKECFTGRPLDGLVFRRPAESSTRIGRKLGFRVHHLDSKRKNISKDELYFLAGNYPKHSKSVWSEISLHSMVKKIQQRKSPAAVFMGYCGDDVWGNKGSIDPETGDLLHTPPISGSNLSEIRLHTGFVTLSPAYMFLRNISQIKKLSLSKEMDPWRLNNDYDRPIPRRIAEEAGIPRKWFGIKKRHITTTYYWPINKGNRQAFFRHLRKNMRMGRWHVAVYYLKKRFIIKMLGKTPLSMKDIDFYDMIRKWATEVLKNKYSMIFIKQGHLQK